MDIIPEDKSSYTTQYQEVFLEYWKHEYCTKHRRLSLIESDSIPYINLFPTGKASSSAQSWYDPYTVYGDDDEYLMLKTGTETISGSSYHAARLLTAANV